VRNILITGGAGFIGSNFIRYVLKIEPHIRIINLDSLTYAGSLDNLKTLPDPARYTFIKGDIRDQALVEDLLRNHRVDTIVHFAAESHVDRSILGPSPFIDTNIYGTFSMLEAVLNVWLKEKIISPDQVHFHHVSTDEVYGSLEPTDPPFSETSPYKPNSPYAASKAASDHLVRAYSHTYDLPVTITNCSNNYGPYQFPEKLIPLMIFNAVRNLPLPVYGDGLQIRDWLYVQDHCEAIWLVLSRGKLGETYNIGGDNQPTNLAIVETICMILDDISPAKEAHASLIRFVKDRPGHDRRYAMNIHKIQNELGWKPQHSLEDGLRETITWYLENSQWIDTIQSKSNYQEWVQENYSKR
jgi:dTDP-glucose 4,6-dehydratase